MGGFGDSGSFAYLAVVFLDVLRGRANPTDAIYEHESGLKIIPASLKTDDLAEARIEKLYTVMLNLLGRADIILIDAAAGLGKEALSAINVADELIIVTNPEMPAVTDRQKNAACMAYAIKKGERPMSAAKTDEVRYMVESMTLEELKDFCEQPVKAK